MSEYLRNLRAKIATDLVMMPAASGVVLNDRNEILLMHPKDLNIWALPGGAVDPGEQPADAVVREVEEETAVAVSPVRLVGVYHERPVRYANGDMVQYLVTVFLCKYEGGTARVNDDESKDVRFFPLGELPAELYPPHRERIEHALLSVGAAKFQFRGEWKP